MGGSFILNSIGHVMYPNNGIDDNVGMLGYWIVSIGSNIFWTISGLSTSQFALSITKNVNPVRYNFCWAASSIERPSTCFPNKYIMIFCQLLLIISLSTFITGGVWCSVSTELQVNTIQDDFQPTSEINTCYVLMYYGELAVQASYAKMLLTLTPFSGQ